MKSMDEVKQARFAADLDRLIAGQPPLVDAPEEEYRAALEAAALLARTDLSVDSHLRRSLKARLARASERNESLRSQQGVPSMKTRASLTLVGVLAAIALALGFSPFTRAFAQNLIQQIGPLLLMRAPEAAAMPSFDPNAPTPSPVPGQGSLPAALPAIDGPTPRPGEGSGQSAIHLAGPTPAPLTGSPETLTAAQALNQYNFTALTPEYLPEGYHAFGETSIRRERSGELTAASTYTNAEPNRYLSIQQATFTDKSFYPFDTGDAAPVEVTVRGQAGVWIADRASIPAQDESGNQTLLPVSYLMWEENDQFFIIDGIQLNLEEAQKIAASLK